MLPLSPSISMHRATHLEVAVQGQKKPLGSRQNAIEGANCCCRVLVSLPLSVCWYSILHCSKRVACRAPGPAEGPLQPQPVD